MVTLQQRAMAGSVRRGSDSSIVVTRSPIYYHVLHHAAVSERPEGWMPWNFQDPLAAPAAA